MAKKTKKQKPKWEFTEEGGVVASYALTHAVIQMLRSPAAQKIDFVFNAIIVTGSRMAELARAIEQFEIIVYYDGVKYKVPLGDGYYSGKNDCMYLGFKNLALMDNQMLTMHECVHAINDIHGSAGITKLDDEAAGYVACALYYRHSGNKWPKRPKADETLLDKIYETAFDLADAYTDKVVNPFAEIQALRTAILAHPLYAKAATTRMTYNGLNHKMRSGTFGLAAALS
jgi:hypothetical protein